jgi:hypothetical protein
MGFRLRRFRRTLESMTPPENFQGSPEQVQPLSQVFNSRHIIDLAVVNVANFGAIAISLSEVEQWLRVTSCLLAAIFTSLKIVESIRSLRK